MLPTNANLVGITHRIHPPLGLASSWWYANLRQNSYRKDDYARSRILRRDWQRQVQDSRQGRYSTWPATSHFRWQTARRWTHFERLQHSERVDSALGSSSSWWMLGSREWVRTFVWLWFDVTVDCNARLCNIVFIGRLFSPIGFVSFFVLLLSPLCLFSSYSSLVLLFIPASPLMDGYLLLCIASRDPLLADCVLVSLLFHLAKPRLIDWQYTSMSTTVFFGKGICSIARQCSILNSHQLNKVQPMIALLWWNVQIDQLGRVFPISYSRLW